MDSYESLYPIDISLLCPYAFTPVPNTLMHTDYLVLNNMGMESQTIRTIEGMAYLT